VGFVLLLITAAARAETIQLEREHGTYVVPVRINDAMTVPFILDTGASEVAIPADVFSTLLRTKTVTQSDFIGTATYSMANGSSEPADRYVLRKLSVGNHVVRNVVAIVVSVKGDPLLGQSFLSKLPAWAIDNERHALVLRDDAGQPGEQQSAMTVPTPMPPQRAAPAPTAPAPPALPEAGLFDRFSVTEVYRGPSTMPDFEERDRKFKDFRTRIRNGIKEGPNFAGRYKVIQFGCGTGCSFVVVADVSTGRVYSFPHGGEYDQGLQLEYRVSSNLIRARWVPSLENMDRCLQEDFLLKDGHFLSLGRSGLAACQAGYCDNGMCK
jgi:clan AA aspartic protease (TIGR02281 family)